MGRKKNPAAGDYEMNKMVRSIDKLAFYEELEEKLGPELQKDIRKGLTPDELFEKYQSYAAARVVQTAIFEPDNKTAASAAKDILDRKMGKAVEKKTVEHRLGKLPEAELRALVKSKILDITPKK